MHASAIEVEADAVELVARSREGDQGAFRELVERFQGYAFRLAFRLLADEDEARDVTQEAFIRVWRHLDRYEPRTRFSTWMYRIVTNLAYDRLRAGRRRKRVVDAVTLDAQESRAPDSAALHENAELAGRIGELVDELPPKQRVVFVLRDLHGLTVQEVAEMLNTAPGTVKANLSYARQKLRERLSAAGTQVTHKNDQVNGTDRPERTLREGAHDAMQEG